MLVVKRSDGGIVIADGPRKGKETRAETLQRVKRDLLARGYTESDILGQTDTLPAGEPEEWELDGDMPVLRKQPGKRKFREAWVWDGSNVVVDPSRENSERWKSARAVRNKLLERSDVEIVRALETNSSDKKLKEHRQALRDVPQNHSDSKNINWPEKQ